MKPVVAQDAIHQHLAIRVAVERGVVTEDAASKVGVQRQIGVMVSVPLCILKHVEMRQRLVPGISLDADFQIRLPDPIWKTGARKAGRNMIVYPLPSPKFPEVLLKICNRVRLFPWRKPTPPILVGMASNGWENRRDDVVWRTVTCQGDFDACTSGFEGLDENEFVLV